MGRLGCLRTRGIQLGGGPHNKEYRIVGSILVTRISGDYHLVLFFRAFADEDPGDCSLGDVVGCVTSASNLVYAKPKTVLPSHAACGMEFYPVKGRERVPTQKNTWPQKVKSEQALPDFRVLLLLATPSQVSKAVLC